MWKAKGSRTFPTVRLTAGQVAVQEVGITTCPRIGWVMTYTKGSPQDDQVLAAQIQVAGPGADGLTGTIAQFTPGPIGQIFIPWPRITVTVTAGGLPGRIDWRATFLPVDDPSDAVGVPSMVDVAFPLTVPTTPANLVQVAPPGATQWACYPDLANSCNVFAETTIAAVITPLGGWNFGGVAAPNVDLFPTPWKRTTTGDFQLVFTAPGAPANITLFWRMDFRSWGDSGP